MVACGKKDGRYTWVFMGIVTSSFYRVQATGNFFNKYSGKLKFSNFIYFIRKLEIDKAFCDGYTLNNR